MKYWIDYTGNVPDIQGKRKKFDNTIYTFDIETSNYIKLDGKILPGVIYDKLNEKEKERTTSGAFMYIWQFSINEQVYYGRTWDELEIFLKKIDECTKQIHKIVYVHNLAFEFQFLRNKFRFKEVVARKSHKVMKCQMADFNFEFKCSYILSNASLKQLPSLYKLDVEKMVGDLDYDLIRTSSTILTDKELGYCKNDCLVVYKYIKRELETYKTLNKIPLTNTGHVRKELKNLLMSNMKYKRKIRKAVNTDPHIFNLLQEAFTGGYTHSNYIYTNKILEGLDSWDFTSSYP